jgi:hypothetical protein
MELISGNFRFAAKNEQSNEVIQSSAQSSSQPPQPYTQTTSGRNRSINPAPSIGASVSFSSSVTMSFYFGRGALQDIIAAFNSATLFEW